MILRTASGVKTNPNSLSWLVLPVYMPRSLLRSRSRTYTGAPDIPSHVAASIKTFWIVVDVNTRLRGNMAGFPDWEDGLSRLANEQTLEDQKPNRPRVWDLCCDSRGNSSRTDMHTQAEQRAHEIEASCGLPTRFGQHSASKIYGLAPADLSFSAYSLDCSNWPACSCAAITPPVSS